MYKFGKRSKERLRGVHPKLVNVLNELIKIMDVTIIEGLRSEERQKELLEQGKTKTKFSKHIKGKAVLVNNLIQIFDGAATGIVMAKLKIIHLMT